MRFEQRVFVAADETIHSSRVRARHAGVIDRIDALVRRRDLENVTIYHLHTTGPAPFADPEHAGRFLSVSLFAGPPVRQAIHDGRADFVPVFLSDIPTLFRRRAIPLDAALLQLARDAPTALGAAVFFSPLPYNLLLLISVWRSAARTAGPGAGGRTR